MKFDADFDSQKSDKNKRERGIDFIEARAIWNDEDSIEVPAKSVGGEVRYGTVGIIEGKLWVALWTMRNGIRIFSVHRAEKTPFERKYYENR